MKNNPKCISMKSQPHNYHPIDKSVENVFYDTNWKCSMCGKEITPTQLKEWANNAQKMPAMAKY